MNKVSVEVEFQGISQLKNSLNNECVALIFCIKAMFINKFRTR